MDKDKVLAFLSEYEELCKRHGIMFDSDHNRVWIVNAKEERIINTVFDGNSVILGSGI
jgi:hypothetical protein